MYDIIKLILIRGNRDAIWRRLYMCDLGEPYNETILEACQQGVYVLGV